MRGISEDGGDAARTWAKGAARPHLCTGRVCRRDTARKGSQPATRGTWTGRGRGTRSGGGASKEGAKADGPVRMRSRRGVRARGSARLKSPKRWRNPSTRPRGPSGERRNRAGSSGEGTPFGGCGLAAMTDGIRGDRARPVDVWAVAGGTWP